jgi:hypothetical protein
MTSRERFLAVLGGRMPDRVPVTLFIQADFLEYGTPPENLAAYVDTAGQFAAYG